MIAALTGQGGLLQTLCTFKTVSSSTFLITSKCWKPSAEGRGLSTLNCAAHVGSLPLTRGCEIWGALPMVLV